MISDTEYINLISLTQIPGFGPIVLRELLSHYGTTVELLNERSTNLEKLPGFGPVLSQALNQIDLKKGEHIFNQCQKKGIQVISYQDDLFPKRLKAIPDHPILIYQKGNCNLNEHKFLAIVGTRKITAYGKHELDKLIQGLIPYNPVIVSGLAFGTDIFAHRRALEAQLPTIGVLAGGIDMLYPSEHRATAEKMLVEGGLISEQPIGRKPDAFLFPARNRLIAGMSEATVIIESAEKGGSMITGHLTFDYNRELFAIPGRLTDTYSAGCNKLIRTQKAHLLTSALQIAEILHWETAELLDRQIKLYESMEPDEQKILDCLHGQEGLSLDELMIQLGFGHSKLAQLILQLELKGAIISLPGKRIRKA